MIITVTGPAAADIRLPLAVPSREFLQRDDPVVVGVSLRKSLRGSGGCQLLSGDPAGQLLRVRRVHHREDRPQVGLHLPVGDEPVPVRVEEREDLRHLPRRAARADHAQARRELGQVHAAVAVRVEQVVQRVQHRLQLCPAVIRARRVRVQEGGGGGKEARAAQRAPGARAGRERAHGLGEGHVPQPREPPDLLHRERRARGLLQERAGAALVPASELLVGEVPVVVGVGVLEGVVGGGRPDFLRGHAQLLAHPGVGLVEHPEDRHHVPPHLLRRDVPVPVVVQELPHRAHPRVRAPRVLGAQEAEARGELPEGDRPVVVRVKGVEEPVRQVVELEGIVLG
mmetsp:Transcript_22249/g.38331  ORF Transcript_22249/g.38331 Transcript_22249/m.38331 type:complete len:341 (-) Transcript_22249:1312-2334(-)